METNFQYVDIGQFSYPLCLVSDISHEVEFGFILKLCVLVWSSIALGMAPHFYFKKKKKDSHLIFQTQKWIFPFL